MAIDTCIIGCGSIGALKPDKYDYKGGANILTWAHAVTEHEEFNLVAMIEPDTAKAVRAEEKWEAPVYHSLEDMKEFPTLIIIATPEEIHKSIYLECIQIGPSAIILEKPAGANGNDCVDMLEAGFKKTIINYTRRYNPIVQEIRNGLQRGEYGKVYSARLYYNRGLLRDGCHGIDIIRYFFNEIIEVMPLTYLQYKINDYSLFDPTISLAMKTERCPTVQMIGIDGRAYSIFEFEIMTEKARIVFYDHWGKMKILNPEPEPNFGGYIWMPSKGAIDCDTGLLQNLLMNTLDDTIKVIREGKNPECSLHDAFKVHAIIHRIRKEIV